MPRSKPIHYEYPPDFSNFEIKMAVQRATSWVKRNMREWPHGHALHYQMVTKGARDCLEFFFVPSHDDV